MTTSFPTLVCTSPGGPHSSSPPLTIPVPRVTGFPLLSASPNAVSWSALPSAFRRLALGWTVVVVAGFDGRGRLRLLFGGGMLLGVGEGASMGAIVRECHVKRETQDVMAVSERRMVLNLRYKRVIGQFTGFSRWS